MFIFKQNLFLLGATAIEDKLQEVSFNTVPCRKI